MAREGRLRHIRFHTNRLPVVSHRAHDHGASSGDRRRVWSEDMQLKTALVVTMTLVTLSFSMVLAQPEYDLASLEKFRAEREATLKRDNGWLTVAGLHFLNQGDNRIGSDPSNDIVLDFASVPKHVGVITVNGTAVRVRAADGQSLVINDTAKTESELHGAFDKQPTDTLQFGPVSFFVHYSGPRLALRVRNLASPLRTNFTGLRWYAPNPTYRSVGTFTPYPERKVVQIPNILGDLEPFNAVGTVTFTLNGVSQTMEAWGSTERLWFVFRDQTSGRTTYPSARFLYTSAVKDGEVVMDFNYAQNPPCAYNPYTTCPLPPAQNRLAIAIDAGEKRYSER
jgi:uncharacterized protein (DUF1684 family)